MGWVFRVFSYDVRGGVVVGLGRVGQSFPTPMGAGRCEIGLSHTLRPPWACFRVGFGFFPSGWGSHPCGCRPNRSALNGAPDGSVIYAL